MKGIYKIIFILLILPLILPLISSRDAKKFPYTIEAEDCEGAGETMTSIFGIKIKGMFSIYLTISPFYFNVTVEEDGIYQFNAKIAQITDKEGRVQTISINGNDYQYKVPYYDTWSDFDFGIHKLNKGTNKVVFKPINGYALYDAITVSEATNQGQGSGIIRLKNWEFGSSEKINLSGKEISSGKTSEEFFKAPEESYVCTPMGGLSGNSDKYYFERELEKVNKTQFDAD